MAINFPPNTEQPDLPQDGDTWEDPSNGVAYIYDGVKWSVDTSDVNLINYWTRNDPVQELFPKYFNDTILFADLGVDRLEDLP